MLLRAILRVAVRIILAELIKKSNIATFSLIVTDGCWHRRIPHRVWLMVVRAPLLPAGSTAGTRLKNLLLLEITLDELIYLFFVEVLFWTVLVNEEFALKSEWTYISVFHINDYTDLIALD